MSILAGVFLTFRQGVFPLLLKCFAEDSRHGGTKKLVVPSSEQDSSLQALVAGETLKQITFDPITDNDTSQSCIGCLWSIMGSASLFVGLYVADHRYGWGQAEPWTKGSGLAIAISVAMVLALVFFTISELAVGSEIYVLDFVSDRLELRRSARGKSRLLQSWPRQDLRRFLLDPPSENDAGDDPCCLYVTLDGGENVRLLEACYPRSFVEQVEKRLAELCEVPSTT